MYCNTRKEFLQAEQSLINNGIFKWAAGSFFVGFSAIVAIYPVYKRILQEKIGRNSYLLGQ